MKHFTLFVALIFTSFIIAQNKTEFTLTLKDGNVVTGTANLNEVILKTDYGKLEIPIKNITSIELGIHPDYSQKNKIENLIKQLQTSNEEMRQSAYQSLIELKPTAIPLIEEMMFSNEYLAAEYTDYTLSNVLSVLKATHNISNDYKTKDMISIDYEYNMGGWFDFKKIELKTAYGNLTIPREKIEKIDVMYFDESNDGMKTFKLLANTHIFGNKDGGWLKTGINVKTGQTINIISYGDITLASLSGNKYKPDGSYKNSTSDDFTSNSITSTYPVYGNTIFKVGENGANIKAGANYNGKISSNGMLYISIYETVYNMSNTGFYIVKIKVR